MPRHPEAERNAFAEYFAHLDEFGADVRTIRLTADDGRRAELTREMVATQGSRQAVQESVVLELVRLVRDNLTWPELLAYIDALPDPQRGHPAILEQRALALSEMGELLARRGCSSS